MSKKNTNTNATITAAALQEIAQVYPNVSLRKLAEATSVSYQMLLKASKKPIAGVLYDPEAINYEEIAAMLNRREVNLETIDFEELNKVAPRGRIGSSKSFSDYTVGMKIYLRDNNETPYEIVYKTETHIVLMLEGTTEPRLLSENTFFFKGPAMEPRTVKVTEEA